MLEHSLISKLLINKRERESIYLRKNNTNHFSSKTSVAYLHDHLKYIMKYSALSKSLNPLKFFNDGRSRWTSSILNHSDNIYGWLIWNYHGSMRENASFHICKLLNTSKYHDIKILKVQYTKYKPFNKWSLVNKKAIHFLYHFYNYANHLALFWNKFI